MLYSHPFPEPSFRRAAHELHALPEELLSLLADPPAPIFRISPFWTLFPTRLNEPPQTPINRPEPTVGEPAPPKRRALLVAVSYLDTPVDKRHIVRPLPNSWHDCFHTRSLLIHHGWKPEEIIILRDGGPDPDPELHPTKSNIMGHLNRIAIDARPGDLIVFQLSGHGNQMRSLFDPGEWDGKDEFIYPMDWWTMVDEVQVETDNGSEHFGRQAYIVDDDLRKEFLEELPEGCKLIALADSCHSGTVFDLPYETRGRQLIPPRPEFFLKFYRLWHMFLRHLLPFLLPLTRCRLSCGYHRPILADVISISSCNDQQSSFDNVNGGHLVQEFCNIMSRARCDNTTMSLGNLMDNLCSRVQQRHRNAQSELAAGGEWDSNWDAVPEPQVGSSKPPIWESLFLLNHSDDHSAPNSSHVASTSLTPEHCRESLIDNL